MNGKGGWGAGPGPDILEGSRAARPARNAAAVKKIAARLQELVQQQMPEELDFFTDWMYGQYSTDELWERHVHREVETTARQRDAQVRCRRAAVLSRLQQLAADDAEIQILLAGLEGFTRTLNGKEETGDDH